MPKLALVQSHIIWEDKEANLRKAEEYIAANRDADLIFFPEMSFTGFSMNVERTAEDVAAGEKHDTEGKVYPAASKTTEAAGALNDCVKAGSGYEMSNQCTCEEIEKLAKKYSMAIGFGWVRRSGAKCRNVYTIINKWGEIVSEYEKLHPFSYSGEDKYFEAGEKTVCYEIDGIPFSTFICYDLRFPEEFREVADRVHAVIIPACWPAARAEHWKTLLKARAIENQLYMIAINCVGECGGQHYSGDSCVIDPDGEVKCSLSEREGIIRYEFVDDALKYREAFPVLRDRRA